jgi:hypothetical protein
MSEDTFARYVAPGLPVVPIGNPSAKRQVVVYDVVDLDAWVERVKHRRGVA